MHESIPWAEEQGKDTGRECRSYSRERCISDHWTAIEAEVAERDSDSAHNAREVIKNVVKLQSQPLTDHAGKQAIHSQQMHTTVAVPANSRLVNQARLGV